MTKIRIDQIDTAALANFVGEQIPIVLGATAQCFSVALTSGLSVQTISYPSGYASGLIPKIFVSIHSSSPTDPLMFNTISGANINSFGLVLSNALSSSNYVADVLALR